MKVDGGGHLQSPSPGTPPESLRSRLPGSETNTDKDFNKKTNRDSSNYFPWQGHQQKARAHVFAQNVSEALQQEDTSCLLLLLLTHLIIDIMRTNFFPVKLCCQDLVCDRKILLRS